MKTLLKKFQPRFAFVRLNLLVVIIPIIFLIISASITFIHKSNVQRYELELFSKHRQVSYSQMTLLIEPVKMKYIDDIRLLLTTMISDPIFVGAKVTTLDNKILVSVGKNTDHVDKNLRQVRDIAIFSNGKKVPIARLTTAITKKPMQKLVTAQRDQLLIVAVLVSVVTVLSVFFAYQSVAGNRLENLLKVINARTRKSKGIDDVFRPIETWGNDEITKLIDAYNNSESERVSHQRKLLTAKGSLEHEVAKRTTELNNALIKVRESSRAKSYFLASMSHELRTPLNAIIGFADILDKQTHEPAHKGEVNDYASIIAENGRHLLKLVNTILDFTKVQAGKMQFVEDEVDLCRIVDSTVRTFSQAAKEKNITLHAEKDLKSLIVTCDNQKIRQIILNLVSNALKFTPNDGEIYVSVSASKADGVTIKVKDSGVGLTEEELNIVMEPFQQADNAKQMMTMGTGLGLPLSLEFANMHGGSLKLTSKPGDGTTATLKLPKEKIVEIKKDKSQQIAA